MWRKFIEILMRGCHHQLAFSVIISGVILCGACHDRPRHKSIESDNFDESSNTGLVTKYHENGKVSTIVKYINGKKHGLARSFYANGNLKSMVNYEFNVRQGEARQYYEDGNLFRVSNYYEGELDGIRKKYRPNGRLMSEIPYLYGWPGTGLKEYMVSGKLKNNYPELVVEKIPDKQRKKIRFLKVFFSDKNKEAEFFIGKLVHDQYLHRRLVDIEVRGGMGIIDLETVNIPDDNPHLNIVGKLRTTLKNPYIVQQKVPTP